MAWLEWLGARVELLKEWSIVPKSLRPARLIVGLGNPGVEYAATRHNAGFWVVDLLAQRHEIALKTRRHLSKLGVGHIAEVPVVLAKPQTYMNLSGEAVRALLNAYHLKPEQMLVVFDDVWLPVGTVRVRAKGSAGGHNGLKSIIAALGTEAFPRVRIGIGQPPEGIDLADYVLSPPTPEERALLEAATQRAADACEAWLTEPIERVMNQFNRDVRPAEEPTP
ncbi:MAG: aminoacyl-tRNA hydrolase [Armatimonadota bacterium]|nr:aminoacyl-tRNA hydrolase [Armatimonadota bacterium]